MGDGWNGLPVSRSANMARHSRPAALHRCSAAGQRPVTALFAGRWPARLQLRLSSKRQLGDADCGCPLSGGMQLWLSSERVEVL
jgi:hypothetical protein